MGMVSNKKACMDRHEQWARKLNERVQSGKAAGEWMAEVVTTEFFAATKASAHCGPTLYTTPSIKCLLSIDQS